MKGYGSPGHHKSKPVTASQKEMSERHLLNHERVPAIINPIKRRRAAIQYDLAHADDHLVSAQNNVAELQHMQTELPMNRRTMAPPQSPATHVNGDFSSGK